MDGWGDKMLLPTAMMPYSVLWTLSKERLNLVYYV